MRLNLQHYMDVIKIDGGNFEITLSPIDEYEHFIEKSE